MKLSEIQRILDAEVLVGHEWLDEIDAQKACGADLMSDVLASVQHNSLLLTGLCSLQVIRTAEMIEVSTIVFVRGKRPETDVIKMGNELNMVIMTTPLTLYHACGKLYESGLRPSMKEN